MNVVSGICLTMLAVGAGLCFRRLARGISIPDRVVALDTLLLLLVMGVATEAANSRRGTFLDALLVVALVAFVGTITVARYIERRGAR
jgi:multicomponent Na+:H+ antiporter subunit F